MKRAMQAIGILGLLAILACGSVSKAPMAAAQSGSIDVIARGLTTPGGFTWNANDVLFVALAGSGGSEPVLPAAAAPLGPLATGETGAVVIIDDGCPTALATGISSTRTALGRIYGAESVAELGGQLYVLLSNAGDPVGEHALANGIYRIGGDGSLNLIADHAAFLQQNPPAAAPAQGSPNPGNPVAMISGNGALWIADALNGLISKVVPGDEEALVADLSGDGFAPADLALGADGSVYASGQNRASPEPGSASVVNISADGAVETVWTGLTMASGIAIGNDGALYATELASGVSEAAPSGLPGSGRLVRQSSEGFDVVVDGLDFPAALGTGPDGAVYFAMGTLDSSTGDGVIARYAPDGSPATGAPANCAPIGETLSATSLVPTQAPVAPTASLEPPRPEDTPTATPLPTPTVPWTPDSAAPTGEVIEVGLSEYAISMPTELQAGPATFLVTNFGSLTHSFAIEGPGVDAALTHELEPGQSGAFTVHLQPGSYTASSPAAGDVDNGMVLTIHVS